MGAVPIFHFSIFPSPFKIDMCQEKAGLKFYVDRDGLTIVESCATI